MTSYIDITDECNLSEDELIQQIKRIYNSNNRNWVNIIILKKNEKLLKVYSRK